MKEYILKPNMTPTTVTPARPAHKSVALPPRQPADPQEHDRNPYTHRPGRHRPAARGCHEERARGRTIGDAFHAADALGGLYGDQFVHGERGRARFGAFAAIDAQRRVAPDAQRAGQGDQSHHGAIGAQVAAPEILHENRSRE